MTKLLRADKSKTSKRFVLRKERNTVYIFHPESPSHPITFSLEGWAELIFFPERNHQGWVPFVFGASEYHGEQQEHRMKIGPLTFSEDPKNPSTGRVNVRTGEVDLLEKKLIRGPALEKNGIKNILIEVPQRGLMNPANLRGLTRFSVFGKSQIPASIPMVGGLVLLSICDGCEGDNAACDCTNPPPIGSIAADPTVSAEIERAWNESNPNAPDVPRGSPGSLKHEQGGWIIWNCKTNAYRVERWPQSAERAGINPSPRPAVNPPECLVGHFHTHPNKTVEGYVDGPSPADQAATTNLKLPGVVRSHGGTHFVFP